MLELGKSQSWTRALKQVAGVTRMDSKPLMDYFSVLYDWLKLENQKNNRQPGWSNTQDPCKEADNVSSTVVTLLLSCSSQDSSSITATESHPQVLGLQCRSFLSLVRLIQIHCMPTMYVRLLWHIWKYSYLISNMTILNVVIYDTVLLAFLYHISAFIWLTTLKCHHHFNTVRTAVAVTSPLAPQRVK